MGKRLYEVLKDPTGKATAARPALPGKDLPFATTPTGGGTEPPTGGGTTPPTGGGTTPPATTYTPPAYPNMTLVLDEQWASIDTTRWHVYDNTVFSQAAKQAQAYMAANVSVGAGTTGATNGTSVKLMVKRQTQTTPQGTFDFTAGMLDSKSAGFYCPRYGRHEFRGKIPHGQGLWSSIWFTAKNGGASTVELDLEEYFHAQVPGGNHITLHSKTSSTGQLLPNRFQNNGGSTGWPFRAHFETPTYKPGWHTWATEIIPVTDATGATKADITQPSQYVKFSFWVDGVKVFEFVDTQALYYTTSGGSADSFWNVYIQGCQVGGNYIGEVDGPLGYSTALNQCLISGTPPDTCSITRNGTDKVQRAQFDGVANVLEIDWFRTYKLTS